MDLRVVDTGSHLTEIQHTRPRITFGTGGITIRPIFFRAVEIPWSDIAFICPTPTYELVDGKWLLAKTAFDTTNDPRQELAESGFLQLALSTTKHHTPWWMMSLLFSSVYAKALLTAEDTPHVTKRVIYLQLRTYRLSCNLSELLDALNRYSRFDLIVCW